MANITIIPPDKARPDTLRVAAYCRVSTDAKEQELSYASQIRNYTELISRHDGWELVDIYADEAVSGTKTDKREDFNRLLADCRKGRIDQVLVKSISRFSRNTRDCLAALRELTRLGVTVQFEKENIDTGTLTTELMVSVPVLWPSRSPYPSPKTSARAIGVGWSGASSLQTNRPMAIGTRAAENWKSSRRRRRSSAGCLSRI